MKISLFF